MVDHVSSICRSGYFQLRQIRTVSNSLTTDTRNTLVLAFVFSRLDYCNSLLNGISQCHTRRLQSLQNAAARVVSCAPRSSHITPVLRQLHWLPVQQRILYKLAMLVYKSLHGLAPGYLADDCQLTSSVRIRPLRSSSVSTLTVPRTSTKFGDRTFAAAGARLWNSLPVHLRDPSLSPSSFAKLLKTHLFCNSPLRI